MLKFVRGAGLPYLFAFLAILIWSSLAILGYLCRHIPAFLMASIGFAVGGIIFLPFVSQWRLAWSSIALGIYGFFGYHFVFFWALRLAPPIEVNLVNELWTIFVVLLAPLFFADAKLRVNHFIGAFLAVVGTALMVHGTGFGGEGSLLGFGFGLITAVIWSTYSLLVRKSPAVPSSMVGLYCLVSALLSYICHLLFESSYTPTNIDWVLLFFMGVGPMGVAFFLWDWALRRGDVRVIGSISYLIPVFATAWLVVFADNELLWSTVGAMVLILGGAAVGSFGPRSKTRKLKV